MIDINAPWRLIADIDSDAMKGYASRYGLTTTDRILNFNFKTIHSEFFNSLPSLLLTLYNELVPSFILTFDECGSKTIETERYTLTKLQEIYSEQFFFKFYFKLRFLEEESVFSTAEKNRIVKDCLQISKTSNPRAALNVFESYVNQPFDYRGSLSYLIKVRNTIEDK